MYQNIAERFILYNAVLESNLWSIPQLYWIEENVLSTFLIEDNLTIAVG